MNVLSLLPLAALLSAAPAPVGNEGQPALPPHVVVLRLVDPRGGPPPTGYEVVARITSGPQDTKEVTVRPDGAGVARIEDLPVGPEHRMVFVAVHSGAEVASTSAIALEPDRGRTMRLDVPEATDDPGAVEIEHVRVTFEKKRGRVEISEIIRLAVREGAFFTGRRGVRLPLPRGAAGARSADEADPALELGADAVTRRGPIAGGGATAAFRCDLPIREEAVVFDQQLPGRIAAAQAISTFTAGQASLRADGFAAAEARELASGLMALVALGSDIEDGRLRIELSGLADGPEKKRAWAALAFSVALLCGALGYALLGRGQG